MGVSTHILDTRLGRPAAGVAVRLELSAGGTWRELARGVTDADGRVKPLLLQLPQAGTYRVGFELAPYFAATGTDAFFPRVELEFLVRAADEHYHVPLLLSPFGYTTYRGS